LTILLSFFKNGGFLITSPTLVFLYLRETGKQKRFLCIF